MFRDRERGRLHHPEFTMLEWYRAGGSLDDLAADCAAILRLAAEAAGTRVLRHGGRESDPFAPPERSPSPRRSRATPRSTSPRCCRTPPMASRVSPARPCGSACAWRPTTPGPTCSARSLAPCVEPQLGLGRATVLTRYPASEAALARLCPDDPRFAARFELYACGVELANAFAELRDAGEQRRRFEAAEAERARIYGTRYPLDEDFLQALADMPDASGIALGFDRLVMLATGAPAITDVLWSPVAEAGR